MQKGDKNKLKLLLVGIKARLEQNRDYFVGMTCTFRNSRARCASMRKTAICSVFKARNVRWTR